LDADKKRIVDALTSTDGSKVNWREMGTVVESVDMLDTLVNEHNAGHFQQGIVLTLLHTLNWTNSENYKKHLVMINNLFYLFLSTLSSNSQ
jgi:hypothetical protein